MNEEERLIKELRESLKQADERLAAEKTPTVNDVESANECPDAIETSTVNEIAAVDEAPEEKVSGGGAVYGSTESEKNKNSGKRKRTAPTALKRVWSLLRDGIIDNNPVFVQLLGMCSTLATTTSVKNALGMGLATSAVLLCSNIMISLLRRLIPKEVRIAAYVVIISGFVTAVELLMKAYLQDLYNSLGIFIPLIVVNCIILARAESFASKNRVVASAIDAIGMGAGYTMALLLIASVRELLGAGTFCGHPVFGENYAPAVIFILPAGAFLTLGFILAVVQKLRNAASDRARLRRLSDIGDAGKTGGEEL